MGVILQADNRFITYNAKYSYMVSSYESGVSNITVLNASDTAFAANAYLLLGLIGNEDCEIVQITSLNNDTGVINLAAATKFPHAESTRVTVIPYNQVRFFRTTTTTFSSTNPLTSYIAIQPSDWFTTYTDESNSTGYGWYIFYNSTTTIASSNSNYIPYTGFGRDTVEDILNDFFTLLSNKELKLVTRRDALSWLNEGYNIIRNKLNLTNVEFTASSLQTLSIVSGTIEYDLPSDFDQLLFLISGASTSDPGDEGQFNKENIEYIPLREAYSYTGTKVRYYIRGSKIGILPTPDAADTYHYMYLARSARLSLNSDQATLPNGGEYLVKDFMAYRAFLKFQNLNVAASYFKSFNDNLNQMISASAKRDANLDSFGIEVHANV